MKEQKKKQPSHPQKGEKILTAEGWARLNQPTRKTKMALKPAPKVSSLAEPEAE